MPNPQMLAAGFNIVLRELSENLAVQIHHTMTYLGIIGWSKGKIGHELC